MLFMQRLAAEACVYAAVSGYPLLVSGTAGCYSGQALL